MKKYNYFLWIVLSLLAVVSCSKDDNSENERLEFDIAEDRGAAPGTEFGVKEGEKYLNVVYFVPGNREPVEDWHWRLSGIMNHVQQFYGNSLSRYYNKDINFKMVRNVANPDYVKIILVKGSKPSTGYKSILHVQNEVMEYFRAHPDEKYSHHTLVLMPPNGTLEGVAYGYDAVNIPNEFMGIVGCDYSVDFNIKYFRYASLRQTYLQPLGDVLSMTGMAMGLTYNASAANVVYSSLTTAPDNYVRNPDKIRPTDGDLEFLIHSELFNDLVDYNDIAEVVVKATKISAENDNLSVVCQFSSSIEPVAFMVYNDFFFAVDGNGNASEEAELMNNANSTVKDAILTGSADIKKLSGNDYEATVEIPLATIPKDYLNPLPGQECAKAELRFRIIHANGTCTPSLMYAKCGTYYEDNEVHADRFRYFYFLEPSGITLPYRQETDLASPKSDWQIVDYAPAGESPGLVIDGKIGFGWYPRFSNEVHPSVTVGRKDDGYWSGVKGFKIHPGSGDDRAKNIALKMTHWDGKAWVEKTVVENLVLRGTGKYYYYIDAPTDYLYNFTVIVNETTGVTQTCLAEIGLY